MTFYQSFPTVSVLLGTTQSGLLDQHAADLAGKSNDECVQHFKTCRLGHWCALNSTPECHDELDLVEWSLAQIQASPNIGATKLRAAFASKAANPDQYDQLLAEIATAATGAARATLLDLEWKTGKLGRGDEEYDADVRIELLHEPVNLEVTLRTDPWIEKVAVHMEDIFDEEGNQIADFPAAKSRRTLTERQWEDLRDAGVRLPTRVSEVKEERKTKPREMTFVSDPKDIPADSGPKAYCADGDDPKVEALSFIRCVQDKAKKFNADGYHVVVLATRRPGFPSESSVFDALFGQAPQIKAHGLFESGLYDEICGVIYLPVDHHLRKLRGGGETQSLAKFFANHNAKVKPSEQLQQALADVFEAAIKHGWVGQ